MNRLTEIETRLSAIKAEIEVEGADIMALNAEADSLLEERKGLQQEIETREALLTKIGNGELGATTTSGKETNTMEERTFALDSREYRDAYLNTIRGLATDEEKRAFDTNNGAIATQTVNDIMSVVKNHAPILEKCTVVYSAANSTYYVEGVNAEGADHTELATISAAADTLIPVNLTPSEVVKLVQISAAARTMSVDAFAAWLAKNLGEAIARKINGKIVALFANASGSNTTITAATVRELLGSIKGDVSLICSQATLFQGLLPLQDNAANNLVTFAGKDAFVYGRPVLVDDHVADGTIYGVALDKVVAGMGEQISVKEGFDIDTNSYKFLGTALFDAKLGVAAAAGKIVATL